MSSEGLGEMFEGDSADRCAGKFPLVSMGVRAECPACADTGARTPIGASGNWSERRCADGFVETCRRPLFLVFWSERRCADGFVETAVGHYFW